MVCWPFTSSPYRRYENDHCNRIYDDGGHWIKRPGVRPPRAGGCRPRCWGRRSADRSRPEGSPRSRAWCRAPCRAAMPWGGDAPPAVDDLADRRHRRALPYPSRRVWTCQTSQIWYAPMSPKQSDFDSETAFIPHLSITQPDWNMNSTMSAYDIRLKPVCRGRRIRMSAHTSTWARCRCRRCAKSIAAFHASSQCATRKVLFLANSTGLVYRNSRSLRMTGACSIDGCNASSWSDSFDSSTTGSSSRDRAAACR